MDKSFIDKLIQAQKRRSKPFEITVTGFSMNPTLCEDDTVTVQSQDDYEIGDILIFNYKQGELLIHRLILKENNKYFCKGDNSFRLEDIMVEQIIGKVIRINGGEVPYCPQKLIKLSYNVNQQFRKLAYDIEKTKRSEIYKLYEKIYLKKEDDIMVYQKNKEMDYIPVDETSLSVFDPESGDAHFFDETGIEILNALDGPCDLETLITKLCEIYKVSPEDIRGDVDDFLNDCIDKKVVLVL